MKKLLLSIMIFSCSLLLASESSSTISPSFDCSKATTSVERMVCENEELSQLDTKLSKIYKSFYLLTKEMKEDQRAWIKQRDKCQDSACIQKLYRQRVEELSASLSNQDTFPQTYLDAMKEAQATMQEIDPKKVTSAPYGKKQSLEFKEDFFRFRDITFKPPIIKEVKDYNDPKLKEILQECHGYRFDLEVLKRPHRILGSGEEMYISPDLDPINPVISRRPVIKPNLYIWKFNSKGKEWLLVRPKLGGGDYFVVDPNYCKELKYDGDIATALNRDKEFIVNSYSGHNGKEVSIISYKNKEYLITMNAFSKSINFWVTDVLELSKHWKQFELEVIGAEYAAITFEIILNIK